MQLSVLLVMSPSLAVNTPGPDAAPLRLLATAATAAAAATALLLRVIHQLDTHLGLTSEWLHYTVPNALVVLCNSACM
jgi:hypothetical protein